jgi:tRNA (cmo5U34)-methyltransferase
MTNEFDDKAQSWDENPMHLERSKAIAQKMTEIIPISESMTALEFGAGTGLLSLLLKEKLSRITLVDSSREMVRIMQAKIDKGGLSNVESFHIDIEKEEFTDRFDIIYTQMVLHHVGDIENIIGKFHDLLNPGGWLAIADLYPEDGSFHDSSFTGHRGIDLDRLSETVASKGFEEIHNEECFVIRKPGKDETFIEYPVFLLTARKIDAS